MDLKSLKDVISERFKLTTRQITYIAIAVLAIILLVAMQSFESGSPSSANSESSVPFVDQSYEKVLTAKLEKIVSQIDGVGKVSVMLTIKGSSSYVYVEDVEKADLETKSKTVIIGNKEALIKRIDNPTVEGVLVVCTGGGNASVKEKVIYAVSTVLNISSNKVYVTKSN